MNELARLRRFHRAQGEQQGQDGQHPFRGLEAASHCVSLTSLTDLNE
jgi:hypothetical protein